MGRSILTLTILLAAAIPAWPQAAFRTSADLVRSQQLRTAMRMDDRPEETVAVMTDRATAQRLLADGAKARSSFAGVTVFDLPLTEWHRHHGAVDPALIVTDEGFLPSEMSPAELAHAVELQRGIVNTTPLLGRHVLLATFDSGVNWTQAAFRRGRSGDSLSIALIWDQTEAPSAAFPSPGGQSRGRLYDREQLTQAAAGLRADVTTTDRTGHGTAVAAVALSLAPEADLVVIKGGDERFSEAGFIEALVFLDSLGAAWQRPVVLNVSFGSQRGPHDGSQPQERAIDAFVSRPGRAVIAAAGNDGGRGIHAEGMLSAWTDSTEVPFTIPAFTPNAGPSNDVLDIEVWFADTTELSVTLETPTGRRLLSRRSGAACSVSPEGVLVIDRPAAGRMVTVQLSDAAGLAPAPGSYRLILRGGSSFHAWITRSHVGTQSVRFAESNANVTERTTVHSPAVSAGALAVGASEVHSGAFRPAAWSSAGPRADGRPKPELSAPGSVWMPSLDRRVSGTSISAPIVAGVVALLFEARPEASWLELRTALIAGAIGDDRQLDAARAVSVLTGRSTFGGSYLGLEQHADPAPTLTWTTTGLANAVRFSLVDAETASPLVSWLATEGTSLERVVLTPALADRLASQPALLVATDAFGRSLSFDVPGTASRTTSVTNGRTVVAGVRLGAFPNPFNASTVLDLEIPADGVLSLAIYSIDGREVARLHDGPVRAGSMRLPWMSTVASGNYFVRNMYRPAGDVDAGGATTLKLVVMR